MRAFFYGHNSRAEEKINARLEAIAQAKPLTEDPALIAPLQLQVECWVASLRTLQASVAQYDERLAQVFATHSEAWLFEALPGCGPVLAPRLAAAFGTMRANFEAADALLSLSGVAPVKKQSGGRCVVQFRYARPVFLHQSLVEFAKCSVGQCEWAQRLYEHELQRGKARWVALRKVAFKWVRILWRCWQDRVAYDETKYLRSLEKAGVKLYEPLYRQLPAAP